LKIRNWPKIWPIIKNFKLRKPINPISNKMVKIPLKLGLLRRIKN